MSSRGAEFRKADFQIHSPRDGGWEGPRPEDALQTNSASIAEAISTARADFCKAFIRKCVAEGLRAIALTDHHEGIYAYEAIATKKSLELAHEPIDLWIFPGMELTCKDACQALIIFDADLPQLLFEKARGKLGLPADCNVSSGKGIAIELLGLNIEELQPLLQGDNELRDRFIILPHVKPGGHKTVLRTGFHKRFKDMPYVGGYMDQCYPHQLNGGDRRILDGEIPAWSSDKRGVISTSDARHSDFRLIGQHASWIKLASPTAESIRQAMLAPDSRIRHEDPRLPSVVITKVTVTGANYIEDDEYLFNQQMNSIIGGRGAGKSSLLEYIRFSLGCSALDEDATNADNKSANRMRDMLKGTLSEKEGRVVVDVLLNGAPVSISRSILSPNSIQVNSGGSVSNSTAEDVTKLIPIQPFRQGELSDLARDEVADRLLELVTANASDIIKDIEVNLRSNGQRLSEALAKAVRLTSAKHRKQQVETASKIMRTQIESLQKLLGLTAPTQGSAISDHDKYLDEERNVKETTEAFSRASRAVNNILTLAEDSIRRLTEKRPALPQEELEIFYTLARQHLTDPSDVPPRPKTLPGIKQLVIDGIDEILTELHNADAVWKTRLSRHEESYEAQKKDLVGQQDILARMEDLNERLKRASTELEVASAEEQEFHTADIDLTALRTTRRELHRSLIETVGTQIATIEAKSGELARGELSKDWDFSEGEAAIRVVLELPMLREKRIDDLLTSIKNADDPIDRWDSLVDELLALVKWKEGAAIDDNNAPVTPQLNAALDAGFMEG